MESRLKQRVREIVQIPSAPDDYVGRAFDAVIIALIFLNTAAVILETVPGFVDRWGSALDWFELVSLAVFVGEYLLRLWSITAEPEYAHPVWGRLRWAMTPYALIDLVAILPALLFVRVDLRWLRVLRVIRLLKLSRYADSVQILTNVVKRSRSELLTSFALVLFALMLTSSLMYYAESSAQPEAFSSIPKAMWWGIVALTTTGYGDVVPITGLGRLLAGLTAILGVMFIALPVGILSSSFVQEIEARRKRMNYAAPILAASLNNALAMRRALVSTCPHCGKDIRAHGMGETE